MRSHDSPPTVRRPAQRFGVVLLLGLLCAAPVRADDADKARRLVDSVCSRCHGIDGNSSEPKYPKLAGRHPEYLARELKEFSSGARQNEIMTPIAAKLDADDFRALGDYFGAQKPSSGKVLDQKAAAIGMKLYLDGDEEKGLPACAGCHGTEGAGSKRFPRLAGQHREYLIDQLVNFRNDVRNYAGTRLMRQVAKRMTDDEIKAVAEFLVGL